jgi:sortase A
MHPSLQALRLPPRAGPFACGARDEREPTWRRALRAATRPRRWLLAAIIVAAAAGGLLFGRGAWLVAKAELGQYLLERAFERMQSTGVAQKPWPWADTHPLARIVAPEARAEVLVLAGASGRTLAWGPGHLDDSAPLGGTGNAIVSAHRDTHFRFLRDIAIGDDIVVELADGARRRYSVRERYLADVRSLRLARTTFAPTLTLVTCYPFDAVMPGGPQRLVVVAEAG